MEHSEKIYDVAVIGGGIAGAGIAREAALRNLNVVLFEKNDFGSGTSSKSSKLIHGGIRYLDIAWGFFLHGQFKESWKNFRFVFESLRECRRLEKIAPNLVHPLQIVLPIYKEGGRNPLIIYLGVLLYFFLSCLSGKTRVPKFLWNHKAVSDFLPGIRKEGLLGGVIIWDRIVNDLRLTQALITSAKKNGAETYAHSPVTNYHYDSGNKSYEIRVNLNGNLTLFKTRKLVNASGAWIDEVNKSGEDTGANLIVPVSGTHITLPAFLPYSTLLRAQDNRFFFVINFEGHARVGTTERLCDKPDDVKSTEEEINYLLNSLSHYFPEKSFEKTMILSSDAGIRPLAYSKKAKTLNDIPREHQIMIGPSGVLNIIGVKLTDHRRAAEETIDLITTELRLYDPRIKKRCISHRVPL